MIGKTISHYKIIEEIGRGGMGEVYLANDLKLERKVAIKFLPQHLTEDNENVERFEREAKAAASLNHSNIITIYEIAEEDNQIFIVMEYVEGTTLRDLINSNTQFPVPNYIDLISQLCAGLSEAHQEGIVHRDIKPENILIDKKNNVKILDFGLAKLKGVTNLTQDSSTLGTIRYMSPEQVRGEEIDHRSDIWSVGVILHELLTGKVPFTGDYDQAVLYSILNDAPDPVFNKKDPDKLRLKSIINKVLTKEPDKRYQTIDQFHQALESITILNETDRRPVDSGKIETRKKRIYLYTGLTIIIILSLLFSIMIFIDNKDSIDSIAVLPLTNLSGDSSQEFFSDGMTEAVISELANIKALKVISRTSVMRYKNTDKLLPDIANELNVEGIVEGSILRDGDKIRITAQLIHATEDRHLWVKNYEREMQDVLTLQREVAGDIAKEIRVSLTDQEKETLNSARTIDPEAHEAYLRGLYHWNKRSKEDLHKSISYYEKAIKIDPQYAEAYAGLAQTYIVMVAWNFLDHEEGNAKEYFYAKKALELNDNLSAGYVALAANLEGEWRWQEAEDAYKKAIAISPNYATAHQWYAEFLSPLGRHEEAIKEMKIARELDPLSLIIIHNFGLVYSMAREYEQAIAYYKKVIEFDENFGAPFYFLYLTYLEKKEYDLAIEAFKKMLAKYDSLKDLIGDVEKIYKTGGLDAFRRWSIDYMLAVPEHRREHDLAVNYAALGEVDSAFYWLDQQVENKMTWVRHLKVDPALDTLRSDPRFDQLLKRMNLIP
jgi:serine/threonine protein kinase/Tfp pilus assembly protein PilF